MTRVPDRDRDVYGDWVVLVMNATRQAKRANMLMSEDEFAIILRVEHELRRLDPRAEGIRVAKVGTRT